MHYTALHCTVTYYAHPRRPSFVSAILTSLRPYQPSSTTRTHKPCIRNETAGTIEIRPEDS